ncbi:MAG: 50S ribosomal protein L6 [Deltaproteobacteria bacterium]|nr:50S ribosomal protein L6 [Deltaproteobacteria bacterium]
MSRTGKKPVVIPEKVKVQFNAGAFTAEGPLGKEIVAVNELALLNISEKEIKVDRVNDSKQARCVHGLVRSLVSNAVEGVASGFTKNLEINGVGYRAEVKGKILKLNLGFSHIVDFPIPEGIKITAKEPTKIEITGSNKELVGRVAAKIRGYRPPEPYKGKGVKYAEEVIVRKVGKAAGGK